MKKTFILIIFFCTKLYSQNIIWENLEWANDVKGMLSSYLECGGPIPENSPCNIFLGKALARVYNIHDFDKPGTSEFLSANQIAAYVENDDKWTLLGNAEDQITLNEAQGYANTGKAVIAVEYVSGGHGHVVIIIPGNLEKSDQWNLNCPNSASFFLNKPLKSYVGMKLSYGFSTPKGVKVYGRNF